MATEIAVCLTSFDILDGASPSQTRTLARTPERTQAPQVDSMGLFDETAGSPFQSSGITAMCFHYPNRDIK